MSRLLWRDFLLLGRQRLAHLERLGGACRSSGCGATPFPFSERADQGGRRGRRRFRGSGGRPLLALTAVGVLKELAGFDKVKLDDDPIKDQIKQSWLQRKRGNFDEAIRILEEVMVDVQKQEDNKMAVTRVLDELANTYYFKGDLDNAFEHFKMVVQR